MSILSGYKKFKRYVLTDSGYQLCSQWTSSNTVHFDDGNTAQTKVGAINGITDSLTATSSNVALSAKSGKNLQDQITELNSGLYTVFNRVGINEIIILPNETTFVELSEDHTYLASVRNTYNVGSFFLIQTGSTVGGMLCTIDIIVSSPYFTLEPTSKTSFNIISGQAGGYLNVLQLDPN